MASIKCKICNLVNFSNATNCKRCGNVLNEFSPFAEQSAYQTNIEQAAQPQQYQPSFEQSNQTQPLYQEQNPFHTQPLYQEQNPFQTQTFYQEQNPYQTPPAPYQPYQMPPPPNLYNAQYQPQQFSDYSCIKCGTRNNVSIRGFKKSYVPPLAYLSLLLGFLIGLIIILVVKVNHTVNAPFCLECHSKFKNVGVIDSLTAVFFLFGFIAAIIAGVASQSFFVFMIFFGLCIGGVVWGKSYSRKHNLKFKRVNSHEVVVTDPLNGDVYLYG